MPDPEMDEAQIFGSFVKEWSPVMIRRKFAEGAKEDDIMDAWMEDLDTLCRRVQTRAEKVALRAIQDGLQ